MEHADTCYAQVAPQTVKFSQVIEDVEPLIWQKHMTPQHYISLGCKIFKLKGAVLAGQPRPSMSSRAPTCSICAQLARKKAASLTCTRFRGYNGTGGVPGARKMVSYSCMHSPARRGEHKCNICFSSSKWLVKHCSKLRYCTTCSNEHTKARQSRFIVSHQCSLPLRPATSTVIITFQTMTCLLLMAQHHTDLQSVFVVFANSEE